MPPLIYSQTNIILRQLLINPFPMAFNPMRNSVVMVYLCRNQVYLCIYNFT